MTDEDIEFLQGVLARQHMSELFLEELLAQALKDGDGLKAIQDARLSIKGYLTDVPSLTPVDRSEMYKQVAPFLNRLEARFQGKNLNGFDLNPYLRKDSALNNLRRIILLVGLLIVAGVCLRPPYRWEQEIYLVNLKTAASYKTGVQIVAIGHYWIWGPPEGWTSYDYEGAERTVHVAGIDWARLGVYVGLTIGVCVFVFFASKGLRLTKKGFTR